MKDTAESTKIIIIILSVLIIAAHYNVFWEFR